MDIDRVLMDLREERDRLSEIIVNLERLQRVVPRDEITPKRRGRKSMDKAARMEVSERMKKYWSQRRGGKTSKAAGSDGSGAQNVLVAAAVA